MLIIKIIGDCRPEVDFSNIGHEVVCGNDYDVILSCFKDNTTPIVSYNNSLAMVLYTKDIPKDGPTSQNYICSRTKSARAVIVEGDRQFWRQMYRYREAVFWCRFNHNMREKTYRDMFEWMLWEKALNNITLEDYTKQLIKEGINPVHQLGRIDHPAPQFAGDEDWKTKREPFEGVMFTGFDPRVVEILINDIEPYHFKNEVQMQAFIDDPLQHPKAENSAYSWKRLFWGIAKHGVSNPVRIYKYKNGRVVLTKGKHRYISAVKLGYKTIPAVLAHEV